MTRNPVALRVTAIEVQRHRPGSGVVAMHGTNLGRPWRMSAEEAVSAAASRAYTFHIERHGNRTRLELTLGPYGQEFAPLGGDADDLLAMVPVIDVTGLS